MPATCLCFGEILWDVLPGGRFPGGAPFNVACHLTQLRAAAALVSAVGRDASGDEILAVARANGVNADHVARSGLPTGTVKVTLNAARNATYDIVRPVAWDEIVVTDAVRAAAAATDAFVFGSLAARSPHNRERLHELLTVAGPLKCFDVNLRPPFDDVNVVLELAGRADVVKLNHEEAARLAAHVRGRPLMPVPAEPDAVAVAEACEAIAGATGVRRLCVTMAAGGASFWHDGHACHAPAPRVDVRDTVGAGDAFMAGLVVGLTHGTPPRRVLGAAAELGAYVASRPGATPTLPPAMADDLVRRLTAGA